tara:strand:- start:2222 stop:2365 length:144 start_codon:yes stop_codon:yes gene_type:complete
MNICGDFEAVYRLPGKLSTSRSASKRFGADLAVVPAANAIAATTSRH